MLRILSRVLFGVLLVSLAGVGLLLVGSPGASSGARPSPTTVVAPPVSPTEPPVPTVSIAGAPGTQTPDPALGRMEMPEAGARLTLPVHVLARVGEPGERVTVMLRWQDGTELTNDYVLRRGEDGGGLLIESVEWLAPGQRPPQS